MTYLPYHNQQHVNRNEEWYNYFGMNDNHTLLANRYHDKVYDKYPNKEFRSAHKMLAECEEYYSNETLEKAFISIMATTNHSISDWPEYTWNMIRIDLADLSLPERARENYYRIIEEGMMLYNLPMSVVKSKNAEFMRKLKLTVINNRILDKNEFVEFWDDVLDGVKLTIALSNGE